MQVSVPELKHHHCALSVPDLEQSIAWYERVLGFELERRDQLPAVPADVAFLKRGDLRIELFQPDGGMALPSARREPHQDLRTHGHKHCAFAVQDLAQAQQWLQKCGADIVFARQMGDFAVLFLRDNSGNLLELFQAPELWRAAP